ncbi:MAG: SIMPL domain-containing protein [Nitrososphaerales archaeon]|nr:SIMPL domain-containing protein [Nitrososphaerales archaeon]
MKGSLSSLGSSEGRWLYMIVGLLSILSISAIIMNIATYSAILALPQSRSIGNNNDGERTISTSGIGIVSIRPDTVSISIGVDTQASTAQEALRMNSEIMNRVIINLRQLGVEDREIKTTQLSLQPQYIYPQNKEPILIGYKVSNTITITTQLLERAGLIIDRAITSGANRLGNIYFTISDDKQRELKNEAIRMAIEDAKRKAEIIANASNVKIIGVKSIIISDTTYHPIMTKDFQVATSIPTILPGESQITVNVQVVYLIG